MKTLIIVESPAKCKKIESFLGPNYKCVASYGHIRELAKNKGIKCIDIENNYTPSFNISKHQKKNIDTLKKLISTHDDILLATDDDREGEAIAWHICIVFKLDVKTTKRIIFHEITENAIVNAVNNPTTINMDKVFSQKARQVLDFLVGFTISPLLWKYITKSNVTGLSAGRCQTPALRLIYENYLDIKNNPGKTCYSITGYFTSKNLPFKLNTTIDSREKIESFLEETVNHNHIISLNNPKDITRKPPQPFTTSSLQQKASNELHYSPKDTMRLAQTLYELGYITYMRTDSKTYSSSFVEKTKQFILKNYGSQFINKDIETLCGVENREKTDNKQKNKTKELTKTAKTTKNVKAQEAHEAIRPTNVLIKTLNDVIDDKQKIGPREKKLYSLIWKNTIQSCMTESIFSVLKSEITAPQDTKYEYSEEQVIFEGWNILDKIEKINPMYAYLKSLKNNASINYNKITTEYNLKEQKQHYNEAKLVSLLEKNGIGRPSTFSSLVSKIQERGYVKKDDIDGKEIQCIEYVLQDDTIEEIEKKKKIGGEKSKLILQPIGLLVIEFLLDKFPELFNYTYTANMEEELDDINIGKKIWYSLCDECYTYMNTLIANKGLKIKKDKLKTEAITETKSEIDTDKPNTNIETKSEIPNTTIQIDENHVFKIARYGPVIVKKDETGKDVFIKVKDNIDLQDIRDGKLTLKDIIKDEDDDCICIYNGVKIIVKKGKYGLYFDYKGKSYSLKPIKKHKSKITIEDIQQLVEKKDASIVREINNDLSIRTGKFGDYVFYKTTSMKKPEFHSLKDCGFDYKHCDLNELIVWIRENVTEK
jgi:DNA topoisomerase I